jgi:RNA polymerase sigma-70 factor (ECF subfamily)
MSALPAKRGVEPAAPDAPRHYDSDKDVIELVQRGEYHDALRRLMQHHGTAVFRYCREALRDAALAEDVQQQVFIEAYRNLGRFSGHSSLRTWLFGIARHRVLDTAKRRRRSQCRLDEATLGDLPDPRPSVGESIDDRRWHKALLMALAELPASTRDAVLLRFRQGMSYEGMAAICAEKPGTLQARVVRALPHLRARIETLLADPNRNDGEVAMAWPDATREVGSRQTPMRTAAIGDYDNQAPSHAARCEHAAGTGSPRRHE